MLCSGYRPTTSEPGHHQLLVQALPLTAGIAGSRVRVLDCFRGLRNQVAYRGAGDNRLAAPHQRKAPPDA
jgi:hypothetical protein